MNLASTKIQILLTQVLLQPKKASTTQLKDKFGRGPHFRFFHSLLLLLLFFKNSGFVGFHKRVLGQQI